MVVNVSGSQTYGASTASFIFGPSSVSLAGNLVCATVNRWTEIGPALAAGSCLSTDRAVRDV